MQRQGLAFASEPLASLPPDTIERVSELISLGDIAPSPEAMQEAEREIQDYLNGNPLESFGARLAVLRSANPRADEEALRDIAERDDHEARAEQEDEIANFRRGPFVGIAQARLGGLSKHPIGFDLAKQEEYVKNCEELQEALQEKAQNGEINSQTHEAYATALNMLIEDMEDVVISRINVQWRTQNAEARLTELLQRYGDIQPHSGSTATAIANAILDSLSNPLFNPTLEEPEEEYSQSCQYLARALHRSFVECRINQQTYAAYKEALDMRSRSLAQLFTAE